MKTYEWVEDSEYPGHFWYYDPNYGSNGIRGLLLENTFDSWNWRVDFGDSALTNSYGLKDFNKARRQAEAALKLVQGEDLEGEDEGLVRGLIETCLSDKPVRVGEDRFNEVLKFGG